MALVCVDLDVNLNLNSTFDVVFDSIRRRSIDFLAPRMDVIAARPKGNADLAE
jgi:hypothetical protein